MTAESGRFSGLAVYFRAPVFAMLPLGFVAGIPLALTAATLGLWMRREGVDLADIGLFGLVGTPYAVKFLWAPLIDRLSLPPLTTLLGRRRGWMVWLLSLLMAAIAALGIVGGMGETPNLFLLAILALSVTFLSASLDIVLDAYRIESMEEEDLGAGAAMYVYGYRMGMLAAGAGVLYIAESVSWTAGYVTMAALTGIGLVTVLLRPEPDFRESADVAAAAQKVDRFLARRPHITGRAASTTAWLYVNVVEPFLEFSKRHGWLLLLLFATIFKFGDALAGVMTPPLLADLHFTNVEIANVSKVFGLVATLAGLAVCGVAMKRFGLMRTLWTAGILQLVSNGMFSVLAITGHDLPMLAGTIGFENFATGLGTGAFVAYLSSLCNLSFTATQYAFLSSLFAFARTWMVAPAGFLAEAMGWPIFFAFTMLAALPGLILLWIIHRYFGPAEGRAVPAAAD